MNVPRWIRRLFRAPYDGLRNFGVVEPGRLYRCGQPRPEELAQIIEQYSLKTVVALRGARDGDDPDAWEQQERAVCEGRGVQFVTIPCNHKNPPSAEQFRVFLKLAREPERTPLLVHCRIGQQRTGLFCALYRVAVQGAACDAALAEMDACGFQLRHPRHRRLLAALLAFLDQLSDSDVAEVGERAAGVNSAAGV
ncbi:MAG: tyrosine-protein phosphatase [Phycisphaerae bacterium]|nr:tyrosine-protein phosphatase [Phycisphaerae bacterium]MCZ2399441.1 tyrosine-protein phosphatase [Phycisphaerae bacterium]